MQHISFLVSNYCLNEMVTYCYVLKQREWKPVVYFLYISVLFMLFIIGPIIMPVLRWIISYIFSFLTEQDFFPRPLIILITLSKAPFKSVLILFFRWGENHCGIRRHHFNNVIIFILLFPILFTNHTNILFVSLPILPFFPGSLLPADWAADTDAVVSSLVNIAN